ncbi:MAG: aspartate kinase [Candidatus Omnitrophica bacterium CG11_big_fil_rev_8_21_14_0_20_64_10]|nr:MAG: aspartate kinase [Candidatus Omnitrophica bacterium CG11_big_fil_rev_8_21_14_0_20_64_10]
MKPALVVQKYGGSSVADPARIRAVARRVVAARRTGKQLVVVVSALGDTTDELVELAAEVSKHPPQREMDLLLSTGEQVSAALLAMAIRSLGVKAAAFTGAQVGIITDRAHTQARIQDVSAKRIHDALKRGCVVTVAGFQGMTPDQEITTLGRGGSDLTAVALASALKAKACEIYTDVEGVYTADPRIVPNARKLSAVSYDEMLELASLGAQVMQARSIEVAKKYGIKLHLRSSFSKRAGTVIGKEEKRMEQMVVSGVTLRKDEAKVTIQDVPDRPGVAAKIFKRIADSRVNVDMIVQNESKKGHTDVSFTVDRADLRKVMQVARRATQEVKGGKVTSDPGIAKLSVVGVGMRSHSGIAAKMFEALADESVNIGMISTSEIKISITIRREQGAQAVRAIHDAFGLGKVGAKVKAKGSKGRKR